jgi:hypothetical protein
MVVFPEKSLCESITSTPGRAKAGAQPAFRVIFWRQVIYFRHDESWAKPIAHETGFQVNFLEAGLIFTR